MEVVQLFSREERNLRDFDREHLPYRRAEEHEIFYYAIFFPFTELVGTLGMAAVIWFGSSAVLSEQVAFGVLSFSPVYPSLFSPHHGHQRPLRPAAECHGLIRTHFRTAGDADGKRGGPRRDERFSSAVARLSLRMSTLSTTNRQKIGS